MSMYQLADRAVEYAQKAISADKAGDYETAVKYYKIAVDFLTKYLMLYPDAPLADFYKELIGKYKQRIAYLEKIMAEKPREDISTGTNSHGSPGGHVDPSAFEVLTPEQRSKKTFEDLVDLESVKRALKRTVIYPVKDPSLYPLGWPKGILLFGPPGCGKTEITIALANEIKAVLINVSPATVVSKWLGDTEKNVKALFTIGREYASKGQPVIIFIDEVDALFQQYSVEVGGEKRGRNQFLIEMDGLTSKEYANIPLFVIGATNKPWNLDIGFIRRFERRIYVPPPNKEVRKQLFEHYTKKLAEKFVLEQIDYDKLADLTEGYSSSDIVSIVKEVQNNIVEEINEKGISPRNRKIKTEDFIEVISKHKPSIDTRLLEVYKEWNKQYGTYSED
ncbi:MAG: AAA family ATPase [Thermosphaera sp.]|nr:AAA family ATPase [Thermosphaera sp.]